MQADVSTAVRWASREDLPPVHVPSRVNIPLGRGDLSLGPMMWLFLAILVTFLVVRVVTRLIRSGSGGGVGLGNVRIAGNHVHHQVFGILIIIGTGIALVSATPRGAALDAAAAVFGIGVGLTVDEFALWLHMEDVYWAEQGRKSVDAIFCVLVITGALIGGTSFFTGRVGTAAWWSSVAVIVVNLLLCVICLLKGKVVTGVIGIFISIVAIVGAVRLAKPESWWAQHRYANKPRLANRAASRYDQRHRDRWNRLRDLVAGAPSEKSVLKQMSGIAASRDREDLSSPEDFSAPAGEKSSSGKNSSRSWHGMLPWPRHGPEMAEITATGACAEWRSRRHGAAATGMSKNSAALPRSTFSWSASLSTPRRLSRASLPWSCG